jgi:hypothetical protein
MEYQVLVQDLHPKHALNSYDKKIALTFKNEHNYQYFLP